MGSLSGETEGLSNCSYQYQSIAMSWPNCHEYCSELSIYYEQNLIPTYNYLKLISK
jgi:hypothetical protein